MKRTSRLIAALLIAASVFSIGAFPAFADYTPGLNAFDNISAMTSYTYSDLVSNHWAYSGIKVCHDKGIMIGYPDGTFHPEENVNWAHAVTIAARVHSIYHGILLDDSASSNEEWFMPYYSYCSKYNLLPKDKPSLSEYDMREISRYDLAYIFSRIVDAKDLPAISDIEIPDLSSVPDIYLSSVKTMYAAGIMNGLDNNRFNGNSLTTRAQIAEVVARLLLPSEREGHDSRVNAAMANYQANLENDSVIVQLNEDYFCLYKYYTGPDTEEFAFVRADGNGAFEKIYTCRSGEYLSDISAYEDKIYFCKSTSGSSSGALYCYDPAAEKLSVVYIGHLVESYCFYDGQIYALVMTQYIKNNMLGWLYAFGIINDGIFEAKISDFNYYNIQYFHPYGWNGKIYFKFSTKGGPTYLYSYDISTGSRAQVLSRNINTSFFDGHVMYFLAFDESGNYDRNLYAVSVENPGVVSTIGHFPAATDSQFRSIYKFNDTVYCLSAFSRDIYSMDMTGETRIALITGGVYNAMCFTQDKAVLIPNKLTVDNANEIKIYNSRTLSSRDLYGDWLGMSCYYVGKHFIAPTDKVVYSSPDSASTVTNLSITVTEAYYKDADLVIRAKYTNNTGSDIELRSYILSVAIDGTTVAQTVNKMSGFTMKDHAIQSFTFVIGKDDIKSDFNLDNPKLSITVDPTFDTIQKVQ